MNLGLSLLTSMGNETMVSVTDVIDYLVDDPATKVIALFAQCARDLARPDLERHDRFAGPSGAAGGPGEPFRVAHRLQDRTTRTTPRVRVPGVARQAGFVRQGLA
nr:hypothetical protein OG781_08135 [Streptomyces sp. NBC_00830]